MKSFFGPKGVGIVLALIIILVAFFFPEVEGISHEGVMGLGVLAAAVAMWVCSSFPIGVTGMLVLAVGALIGVAPVGTIFGGFGSTTTLFMMTVFALTAAFNKSKLSKRLVGFIARWAGEDSRKLILGVMFATAATSLFMTDTAVIVLYFGLALALLNSLRIDGKTSNLAKCLYIGVPFAGIIGGIGSPAGNSTNILSAGMLESIAGTPVSFFGWMVIGVPISIVMILIAWICLVKILKPERLSAESTQLAMEEVAALGKFSTEEKKTLFVMTVVPLLWILGTWVPFLHMTIVCVISFALILAPGFSLVTFDEYTKAVPWNVIFMVGSVVSLGAILSETGGAQFLGDLVLSTGIGGFNIVFVFLVLGFLLYLIHTFVPIGPGFIPVFLAPLVAVCLAAGVHPIAAAVLLSGITGGNFLFPINPTLAITYKEDNYAMRDLIKVGIIPTISLIIIMAVWIPFMTGVLESVGLF